MKSYEKKFKNQNKARSADAKRSTVVTSTAVQNSSDTSIVGIHFIQNAKTDEKTFNITVKNALKKSFFSDPDLDRAFLHYGQGAMSGFTIGAILLLAKLCLVFNNGAVAQLSEEFFEHYVKFPAVFLLIGVLMAAATLPLDGHVANTLRKWTAKPIFEFLTHGLSISAGAIFILFISNFSSYTLRNAAIVAFIEIYIFVVVTMLQLMVFAIEHGEKVYQELNERFKFSEDFKIALKYLAAAAGILMVLLCFDVLGNLPKDPAPEHHGAETSGVSH
ncbi:MAG: hypothetical protein K2X81_15000 [Candidatus Obscuribacterales bacterium]|nr:hypothetical protein [Candidatus Obscuribacterales bacterium]